MEGEGEGSVGTRRCDAVGFDCVTGQRYSLTKTPMWGRRISKSRTKLSIKRNFINQSPTSVVFLKIVS